MKLKEQSLEDRPREKLMALGPAALTPSELLAILVGSGSPGESAVELMQRILADHAHSLKELGRMSIADLQQYRGMGEAKAITILAACELGKRRMLEEARAKTVIVSSVDTFKQLQPLMADLDHEESYTLYLRTDHSIIGAPYLVSRGGMTETAVDVRIILREALQRAATCIILAHNHPSGSLRPSREDDNLTDRLDRACKIMNIRLLDHLIITDTNYFSYRDQGKL